MVHPVVPATWEAEVGALQASGQPGSLEEACVKVSSRDVALVERLPSMCEAEGSIPSGGGGILKGDFVRLAVVSKTLHAAKN